MSSVTVVVPTHDRRMVLAETLTSILGQRDVAPAVVVVDDGSCDGTAELVEGLGEQGVTLVRHDLPKGVAAARNAGLEQVRTRWVAFCDDDDLWAPTKLSCQLATMEAGYHQWSFTGAVEVDERLRVIGLQRLADAGGLAWMLGQANVVPAGGSSVVADTDFVIRAGGFREDMSGSADWDLWRRLAALARPAVVDLPLVAYRVWPYSMSRDVPAMEQSFATVVESGGGDPRTTAIGDTDQFDRYCAKQLLRNGDRCRASLGYLTLARRRRSARDGVRAAAAFVSPSVMDWLGARLSWRRVPPHWRREVAWLDDLRGR
jgi:hypothetical protein